MFNDNINIISRETFEYLPVENKLDVLFDLLVEVKIDNKGKCIECKKRLITCTNEFEDIKCRLIEREELKILVANESKDEIIRLIKEETKISFKMRIIQFSLILFGSAIGGVLAHWLGLETLNPTNIHVIK
jgi:hypothetical protein